MALSFCPSLRGTSRPGSEEQWRCHCPGCVRSDPGPYLPPVSSFSSEVLSACSPAPQLWRVSAPSSYPASGSVRLAPPAVGGALWHRLRLRPAPGGRRTGWAAPLHHLGTRMAAGSQRPLCLGRRGAWHVSLQDYRVSDTWYQGTSRLDALRTRRTVGFQEGAVKVRAPRGWLASACKGLPTTRSSMVVRSRSREESEVARTCRPVRSSQGSPGSPHFSLRCCTTPPPCSHGPEQPAGKTRGLQLRGDKASGTHPLVLWRWPTCVPS